MKKNYKIPNEEKNGKDSKNAYGDNDSAEKEPVNFFKLFRYSNRLDKLFIFFGTLSAIITGCLQPLNTLIFGQLSGNIIKYGAILLNGTAEEIEAASEIFMNDITDFAIFNSSIGLGMFVFSFLSVELYNISAIKQIYKIRILYMQKLLNQDIAWYDKNQTSDFASRMTEDLIKLEDGLGEKIPLFLHLQAVFLASLILALVKGWELALVCMVSLPISTLAIGILVFIGSKIALKEASAYAAAASIAEEVFSSVKTVIAFGGHQKEIVRYDEQLEFAKKNNIKRGTIMGLSFGLVWFFIYGTYAIAFWYGVKLVLEERGLPDPDYDVETMVTVFMSVMIGSMNFGFASSYVQTFTSARAAAAKVFEVIESQPVINLSKLKGDIIDNLNGNISFRDVHFTYPSRKGVPILQGLSFEIKAGDTVALVGSSGCGKSTCVQMIQRFYDPTSGQICLDGQNLKDLNLTWLRSKIGVVGQEPVLFADSIRENIRYGHIEATFDDIQNAAVKANAHDFIMNLPNGYDTLVGEKGAQLSSGQKQRIAIARALVRNPSILLLDEATSALDTHSESKVQKALDTASKGRTTVIVAHRLSTIQNANKIVVISDGRVVEQGTHKELMAQKTEYYNLVMAQVTTSEDFSTTDYHENGVDVEKQKISITNGITPNVIEFEDEKKDKKSVSSILSILRMNKPEWFYIFISCIGSVIMGTSMPLFSILFGDILGVLVDPSEDYVQSETNKFCIFFVAAGVLVGFANFIEIFVSTIASEKLTKRLRYKMFQAMLQQEMGWYDRKDNGVGALCARLSTEAAHVQGATGQRLGTILQAVSTLGLSVGLSIYYEWRLGLVALSFAPFILLSIFLQHRLMTLENEAHRKSLEDSTRVAVESITNIRTVASLGREETFYQLYLSHLANHQKKSVMNSHVRALVLGLSRSLMFFAYAACMYYGGILIKDEGLYYANVFKVSQALIMGTVSVANALAFSPNLQKGVIAAGKIMALLNRVPKIKDEPGNLNLQLAEDIVYYKQIFFSYPTRPNVKVLKGLDLNIPPNKTIALVGSSGCGKSTILQLLERFYNPDEGQLVIRDNDIRNYKLESLRSHIGIVSQEPNLFDRTLADNIAYGDNTRVVSRSEIIAAAKNANIHDFICSLPLGYDTRIGEKGTQLSGGQKQRIAIARALVRNPKILLLDEATSALDNESEKIVQEALDKAKQGRTCITIAHRLSTIYDADVICVIDNGRVAEIGTHTELLELKRLYYKLNTLQIRK